MPYDPKPTCYPYTEITDRHYLVVKKDDGTVFDKNYPYIDKSAGFKFKRFLMRCALATVAFPVTYVNLGLKVKGRKNLREAKKLLKNGCVSVANHIHMWDYLAIMLALFPRKTAILAWDKNMRGENKTLIRLNGGIPVPVNDPRATLAMSQAVLYYLKEGGWLHVAAEGSMWEYYMPIRPFKKGAFWFAVKSGKPVLPMGFSYREAKGIQKLFYKHGLITLNIGKPLFPDESLPNKEAIRKLTIEAHEAVCRLCGIEPSENIYPPVFEQNRRVDYY
ncbi:MAG: 1-acyl-sn-glycerol-3-phosphate acyltransferase [Clostridia bacterium]|nr:1-acyl-sn-glycerol-3-phosphate acyltransferase [Clostridia bacterium]MBP5765371.1 1-acyl-sn-glycerol-3-phosphate acyltransferase [Clostridia bacterium]